MASRGYRGGKGVEVRVGKRQGSQRKGRKIAPKLIRKRMRGVSNKILDKFTGKPSGRDEQRVSYREIKKGEGE